MKIKKFRYRHLIVLVPVLMTLVLFSGCNAPENEGTVSLTFTGFDRIQVCDQRGTENKQIEGGRLSVTLKTGEGIFVIPY